MSLARSLTLSSHWIIRRCCEFQWAGGKPYFFLCHFLPHFDILSRLHIFKPFNIETDFSKLTSHSWNVAFVFALWFYFSTFTIGFYQWFLLLSLFHCTHFALCVCAKTLTAAAKKNWNTVTLIRLELYQSEILYEKFDTMLIRTHSFCTYSLCCMLRTLYSHRCSGSLRCQPSVVSMAKKSAHTQQQPTGTNFRFSIWCDTSLHAEPWKVHTHTHTIKCRASHDEVASVIMQYL